MAAAAAAGSGLLGLPDDVICAISDLSGCAPALACACRHLRGLLSTPARNGHMRVRSSPATAALYLVEKGEFTHTVELAMEDGGGATYSFVSLAPLETMSALRHLNISMGHVVFVPAVSFLHAIGLGAPRLQSLRIVLKKCTRPISMLFPEHAATFAHLTSLVVREEVRCCSESDLAVLLGRPLRSLRHLDIKAQGSDAAMYVRDCTALTHLEYRVHEDSFESCRFKPAASWFYDYVYLRCNQRATRRVCNQLALAAISQCWLEAEDDLVLSKVPSGCDRMGVQLNWDAKLVVFYPALAALRGCLFVWADPVTCSLQPRVEILGCGKLTAELYLSLAQKLVCPDARLTLSV